ncbi:penicillin-binding protein 2 [Burkholderiales bacterium]|nr:penicillin-binding protein 2 [Burkholderiales bacterium]
MLRYRKSLSELGGFNFRIRGAIIAMLILSALLLGRLFFLQIINADYYQLRAENNRINISPILPNRGLIYDRNGHVLAKNYSSFVLELWANGVEDLDQVLDDLNDLVAISVEERALIEKALKRAGRFSNIVIRDDLSEDEIARFTENSYRFPEIKLSAQLYREYVYGDLTSHLLGYVRRISEADLDRLEQRGLRAAYINSDWIGKRGIEAFYESKLRGRLGLNHVEVDSKGTELRVLEQQQPVGGEDIFLTIDITLQKAAFDALGNQNGALVALDPNNGSVLAFVSKPGYDPSLFVRGFDQKTWREIRDSADRPLVNRVSDGVYPPGSTLKPFIAIAGLEEQVRTPDWSMWDPGFFSLPESKYKFRDWKKGGHGEVNLHKAIVESVDTYFYKLAHELEIDKIHRYLVQFGFGSKTGIDLPSEASGIAPSKEWKKRRFGQPWYPGDTISVGIGQGYNLVTPIQLAVATAALANGHKLVRPVLSRSGTYSPSNITSGHSSQIPHKPLMLSPQHIQVIKKAMEDVMKTGGTAAGAARGADYSMAGKTGTAQVFSLRGAEYDKELLEKKLLDHALFIGYAPADRPTIALAVVVENGGGGGSVAGPIARKVFDAYFDMQP